MKSNEQKLLLENLFSSGDVYARCSGIISGDYFDPEYRNVVKFTSEYYSKYGGLPDFDIINAKFDLDLRSRKEKLTRDVIEFTCTEIEQFCKEQAMLNAVQTSLDDIESGNLGMMMERIKKAFDISLQRDLGVDMYANPEERLTGMLDSIQVYSTGINGLDQYLGGGLARKQLTLFSANSGGGKSIMMNNLCLNYSILHGMKVLYISLELPEDMVYLRNANIISGVDTKEWKERIATMASSIQSVHAQGAGRFTIKRLPNGSTANDIRSYLKQYELEYGELPDMIAVDYLDIMRPNGGVKNLQPYEQDKLKSEELYEILHEFDLIGVSASQQNRDGITNAAPTQAVIAGGITKVNTVDNYISLHMDPAMRIRGEMVAFFLKTRSADGVGKSSNLHFDSTCLRITDQNGSSKTVAAILNTRAKKKAELATKTDAVITESLPLPGIVEEDGTVNPDSIDKFCAKTEEMIGVKIELASNETREPKDLSKLLADKKPKNTVVPIKKIALPAPETKRSKQQIKKELGELDLTLLETWTAI